MNLCFMKGEIISEIEFKFLYKSNNVSICIFNIELSNNSVIRVKAYDENADYVYSKYKEKDVIWLYGYIENDCIVVKHIFFLKNIDNIKMPTYNV